MNIPKMWDAVKAWWGGKWDASPLSGVHVTYHPTAAFARKVWGFVMTEWKFIITALIALGFFKWLFFSPPEKSVDPARTQSQTLSLPTPSVPVGDEVRDPLPKP